ncbi:storkhead-box protein 1 [Trichonephila inaurata madagascariensis]|uniref:Storkhead-box protein 1 n=1 Tax=Trichonephila inaurata madagascariensis TaxID=2747483 RepID=A0A8X7CKY1_9ARAC|nr:storkhead-box protein 1 [Trichonephila inaurata madagascariensis]
MTSRHRKIKVGYFVVSPDTYRQRAVSPLCERQMLMTNEEAIVKLHGSRKECSLAIQVDEMDIAAAWKCSTSSFLHASQRSKDVSCQISQVPPSPDLRYLERSHSLKILRMKGRPKSNEGMDRGGSFKETKRLSYLANELNDNMNDLHKNEKQSMLAKILKRMQSLTDKSNKHVSFSAQFPPLEWLEDDKLHCHSVATQTQALLQKIDPKSSLKRFETSNAKIPWEEADVRGITHYFNSNGIPKSTYVDGDPNKTKNSSVLMRQGSTRHSPSHRYSHGSFSNYAKRRHRHRRSSSESPKIHKTSNGHRNSSGSKSPTDHSDAKLSLSSSSGSANPKAIVNPRVQAMEQPHSARTNFYNSSTLPSSRDLKRNGSPQNCLESKPVKNLLPYSPKTSKPITTITNSPKPLAEIKKTQDSKIYSSILTKPVQNVSAPIVPSKQNEMKSKEPQNKNNLTANPDSESDHSLSRILSDPKLAVSESFSDTSMSCNGLEPLKKGIEIKPLVLKSFVDEPKVSQKTEKKTSPTKEITVDNSVSVEVALEKSPQATSQKGNNISTTVVTEETTVTKENGNSKVVTVTSITTSLSHGGIKDLEKQSPEKDVMDDVSSEKEKVSVNNLNIESVKGSRIIDCSSSCNIVTEVK